MANGWGAYNSAFSDIGNSIASAILRNKELEKQRQEEDRKKQEEQQRQDQIRSVLMRLGQGGENTLNTTTNYVQPTAGVNATSPQPVNPLFSPLANRGTNLSNIGTGTFQPQQQLTQGFQPYTPQDKVNLGMQLAGIPGGIESLNTYNKLNTMFNPAPEQMSTVKIGNKIYKESPYAKGVPIGEPLYEAPVTYERYDFSRPDAVYAVNTSTGKLEKVQEGNPSYVQKPSQIITDYNDKGEKVVRQIYTDANGNLVRKVDIPTGFFKKGEKDLLDPEVYSKILTGAVNQEVALQNLKDKYTTYDTSDPQQAALKEGVKHQYNLINENAQALMEQRLTPKAEKVLNNYYDELKTKTKDISAYEASNQDELKQKVINDATQAWKENKITGDDLRAIRLWATFKYGYINNGAKPKQPKQTTESPANEDMINKIMSKGYTREEALDLIKQHEGQ